MGALVRMPSVGWILMIVGAIGLVICLIWIGIVSRSGAVVTRDRDYAA